MNGNEDSHRSEDEESEATVTIQLDEDDLEEFVIPSPVVPSLPQLDETLTLRDLQSEVVNRIALHLDSSSLIVKSWNFLAHYLGKDRIWITVRWIHMKIEILFGKNLEDKSKFRGSPTVELIQSSPDFKLTEFLAIIRNQLERYDVLIDIFPLLRNTRRLEVSNRRRIPGGSDSGVGSSRSSKNNYEDIEIFGTPLGASEMESLERRLNILILFYPDKKNKELRKYVKWLQKNLEGHGAFVEPLSLSFYQRVSTNLTEALTACFRGADKIIVIPSVEYKFCVDSLYNGEVPQVDERIHQSLKYIHSQMSAEYLKNGCRNHRFYVVALGVPNGFHPDYIPSFLNNTLLFHWPSENTSLMKQLFNGFKDLRNSSLSLASGNSLVSLASSSQISMSHSISTTSDVINRDL